MENSFNTIQQLVANFKANEAAFLASNYSESQVRQDFIDKFFTALGWDVTHTKQFNPYAQEVKIENRVTMPGTQRRADYAFSIAPNFDQIKFFVEAKKPSRSLANADDYFQTIRYAWNTKIPIAVLTDFEEFHILDCRYKPNIKTALERRIGEYRYTDYADKETFAKIFHLFGREAVAAGSLEKYAAGLPKKGTKQVGGIQPVDDAFLEELDGYREILAKAFKKTNESLQGDELTEAVQRTIDRLVFIRFLEDKGIEDKQIISISDPKTAWKSFVTICKRFEPKYNGLVFKSPRILDSGEFHSPDGAAFATICQKISDPTSPYDFNFIPISILGSIYERFLGKVVHATEKRVKVEEKPEVRKAGGVYYTPEYIVQYIVRETVGKLIEGKKPEQIASMAFADIACGSGSFLIEVYAQVLEYHHQYYMNHPESVGKDVLFERDGKKYLTLKKKKEILTNNVYGVDIDFQATEVTQLSLYLKMLENATMNDAHQFVLFRETILPDLRQNIICGNSLIGRDILEGDLFSTVDESKLKPMNYEDAFPKIMKRGGFDAIVGNPPYGADFDKETETYVRKRYSAITNSLDSFIMFVEQAGNLLNSQGRFGMIIPSGWVSTPSSKKLRERFAEQFQPTSFVSLPYDVFYGAYVDTIIVTAQRLETGKHWTDLENTDVDLIVFPIRKKIEGQKDFDTFKRIGNFSDWIGSPDKEFLVLSSKEQAVLVKKLRDNPTTLDSVVEVMRGIETYKPRSAKECKFPKRAFNGDLLRYELDLGPEAYEGYPPEIEARKPIKYFSGPRILLRQLLSRKFRLQAVYTGKEFLTNQSIQSLIPRNIFPNIKYVLAIINSRLISWYFCQINMVARRDDFPKTIIKQTREIPIPNIDNKNPIELSKHDNIVKLVDQLLDSKQSLSAAKTEGEINRLELLCASLDHKIDEAVYELYGLTEDEIKIVEGKN